MVLIGLTRKTGMNVAYGDENFPSQGPIALLGKTVSEHFLVSFFIAYPQTKHPTAA